jgi:dCMP deaminase
MARELAKRSLCTRDQVGALIIDSDGKVIGEGYNGPPRNYWHANQVCTAWCQRSQVGVDDAVFPETISRDYSDCPSLHAEANALMMSDRTLRIGGTIYITSHVCMNCAKLIANSGLKYVIVETTEEHAHRRSDDAYAFIARCSIHVSVNGRRVGATWAH